MEVQIIDPLVFNQGFSHITEQIFEQLDKKTVTKCREVSKSWQEFIDHKNLPWLQIINIPKILQVKTCFYPFRWVDTYLHRAAETGQLKIFEILFENEELKNPKTRILETPFQRACYKGHFKIAEVYIKRSSELNIDLNDRDPIGCTAFHMACMSGHSKIVEMFLQNSAKLNIDLNDTDKDGYTGFHYSCWSGHLKVAKLLVQNAVGLKIDLKAKDRHGSTAFHVACDMGHTNVIEMMIENAQLFNFGLFDQDNKGRTGFQIATENGETDVINLIKEKLPRNFWDY